MSKIATDGLTQSGTGCFIAVPLWQQLALTQTTTTAHNNNINRRYSTPDTPQAGVQRHHTGMRGAGVAPVGCQPQGPACRQPTANTAPVVRLSQPKLVPTLLLGGQGYMCVNNLPKVVTRYTSAGDRTRDLPIASTNHWATAPHIAIAAAT